MSTGSTRSTLSTRVKHNIPSMSLIFHAWVFGCYFSLLSSNTAGFTWSRQDYSTSGRATLESDPAGGV
jgi:hypothetical protein